ncbi:hypothetical protein K4749_05395 [Streptomyces sp. TRM72054]|uniref:hypothetical protein n=1 Tax=Streptomyces sp. TRM72054 TaxID=2870562 RepID=UPI001C8BF8F6|nr:hypothetical protein [Streptomyces sp. TRM72054]MBX9393033.1 hypothetical protein [Streptomyces sp. TRM72054]
MEKVIEWEREFQVWQYSVSHSTLLLRSVNVEGFETRIDVLFTAVELMHLQPYCARLEISEATSEEKGEILGDQLAAKIPGKLYLLNGGEGYVLARRCAWHEDLGDHHSPSKFGPLRGTE